MSLPVGDWQFWVVTAAAALAALYILREVLPARVSPFRKRRKGKAASLTISGKTPGGKSGRVFTTKAQRHEEEKK